MKNIVNQEYIMMLYFNKAFEIYIWLMIPLKTGEL